MLTAALIRTQERNTPKKLISAVKCRDVFITILQHIRTDAGNLERFERFSIWDMVKLYHILKKSVWNTGSKKAFKKDRMKQRNFIYYGTLANPMVALLGVNCAESSTKTPINTGNFSEFVPILAV